MITDDLPQGANEQARSLCLVLAAIEKIDQDYAEYRTEYKAAREKLQHEVKRIRTDILSGQESLPLEKESL